MALSSPPMPLFMVNLHFVPLLSLEILSLTSMVGFGSPFNLYLEC
uniref:Uncharacterized protein n=1 Tax=Rhizophora mucronata TaxID=61149 RepID=A0A2P2Q0Z0_RHIMU